MSLSVTKIMITIAVMVLLGSLVVGVLLGSAVYGWKAAMRAGNEAATLQNMKTIAAVEVQYYNTHKRTFVTFDQLIKEQMLTSKFSNDPPESDGYILSLRVTPKTGNQTSSYTLNADSQSHSAGRRHFYLDSTSATIHINPDRPASASDSSLGN